MDLAEWWQRRRWKALLELIDELPAASRLNEAIQNDPEQAKIIATIPLGDGEDWAPKVRDYDLTAMLLREIREMLASLYQLEHAKGSGKRPPAIKPLPVPFTEVDRQRLLETREWADSLIARLTPQHAGKRVI